MTEIIISIVKNMNQWPTPTIFSPSSGGKPYMDSILLEILWILFEALGKVLEVE